MSVRSVPQMGSSWRRLLVTGALAGSACGCTPDFVAFGYYGAPEDAGDEAPSLSSPPDDVRDAASQDPSDGPQTTEGGHDDSPPSGPCDLTGRWLVTDREVASGLGSQEATHSWYYMEINQTGSAVLVTKGLLCGQSIRSITAVGANVDYPKTWPALLAHDQATGRTATSVATSSGCSVSFDKHYLVTGATVPHYDDPSVALPTTSQEATSGDPGWEDWDQDGNPGYTLNVTGLAVGQIYLASRTSNQWSGAIAAHATLFKLADKWNTEQSLLGYNGSQLLTAATSGTPDNDASLHFVQFARLAASQATGDDATTCAAVRSLAGTLTPDAAN
jgi:hypothetical protein